MDDPGPLSSLYEYDVLAWADRQAALLRCLAVGDRPDEAIDWPNVIEEIQDLGRSELRACKSLLRQALVHLIKLHIRTDDVAAAHWRGEVFGFLTDARQACSPSMRQLIDLQVLYEDALERVNVDYVGEGLPSCPKCCPFLLDELLSGRAVDMPSLVAKLS